MQKIFSIITLLLSTSLIACAPDGSSSSSNSAQACLSSAAATESMEASQEQSQGTFIHPEIFNPETTGLIVKTRTKVLTPSGNPVRVFTVKGISISVQGLSDKSFSVKLEAGQNASEVAEKILQTYDVEYIEPDFPIEGAAETSGVATNQWAHKIVKTYDAWKYTQGDDTLIAVIDSGVDFDHPDLKASEWDNPGEIANGRDDDKNGLVDDLHGWNYVEKNNNPKPRYDTSGAYHGTHVAGIIAGRTNTSRKVSGVAPRAKIMALKFLDENKSGATSNGIKAIRYAIAKKVKIINASWGSYNKSTAMQEVLKEAERAGILFVAASGNYGGNNDSKPFYPASYNYSNILSVTASTSSDKFLSGINYGSKSVDFAAPGSGILSTDMNNGYKSRGGSSMAAPFVAGAAALALSINPNLTYKELKSILLQSSDHLSSLKSKVANGSRINLGKSVNTTNSKFNMGVGVGTISSGIQEDPAQEVCSTN